MSPFDRLMNRVDNFSDSNSFLKSQVASRLSLGMCGIPLELLASLQNMIKLPIQLALATLKVPVKIINFALCSPTLKEYDVNLPGFFSLAKTILKIIGYAIGTAFTATLGLLVSPHKNFRLHVLFNLVTDMKAQQVRHKIEHETAKQRESQREIMHLHIRNLIHAQRTKIAEKERIIAQQAIQRRELEEAARRDFKAPLKPDDLPFPSNATPPAKLATPLVKTIPIPIPVETKSEVQPVEVKMGPPHIQQQANPSLFNRLFRAKAQPARV